MDLPSLNLEWLPGRYAVCRLDADAPIPEWANPGRGSLPAMGSRTPLLSITRTDRELSIVIDESMAPTSVKAERGFVALRIAGTLDMSFVGVLAKLTGALAAANVPLFAISTHDTDLLLVKAVHASTAAAALAACAQVSPAIPGSF